MNSTATVLIVPYLSAKRVKLKKKKKRNADADADADADATFSPIQTAP